MGKTILRKKEKGPPPKEKELRLGIGTYKNSLTQSLIITDPDDPGFMAVIAPIAIKTMPNLPEGMDGEVK